MSTPLTSLQLIDVAKVFDEIEVIRGVNLEVLGPASATR